MTDASSDSSNAVAAAITAHLRKAREASEYQSAQDALEACLGVLQSLEVSTRQNVELAIAMGYSIVAEHHGDLETAVDYNEKLAVKRPDDLPAHFALAKLYAELEDSEGATVRPLTLWSRRSATGHSRAALPNG